MSINRVSTGYIQSQATRYLTLNQHLLNQLQERIASGKNIQRPSDNPAGANRLLDLNQALSKDAQYLRNIQDARTEMTKSDEAISGLVELMRRAEVLATQAANGTVNQDGRNAIAAEIDSLLDQTLQLGNGTLAGRYLFGGFAGDTAPFARTGNDVTFNGTPSTTVPGFQRTVEMAQGVTIPVNVDGTAVFGSVDVDVVAGVNTVVGGSGPIRSLMTLKLALEQGNGTAIRGSLDTLKNNMDTVLGIQAGLGANLNRLELAENRIEQRQVTFTQQVTDIQEVDLAKALSDLNFQQNVFQASLGVSARVLQTSLMDFLR
jgi:flagellar hook-associated protein 3 FlgL